jgi:crotonobetainyl-CoA:carnitine CoA-transferase CaiB-like acyl-CoA transferase
VIPALLPAATFEGFEARMDPVPAVGQQTELILGELGYSVAQIAELKTAGAI